MAQLGVYGNNDPSSVISFEQWLDRPVDVILMFCGPYKNGWSDAVANVRWVASLDWDAPLVWTVLPIPLNTGDLSSASRGAYNSYYKEIAQVIAAEQSTGDIIVRPFHEFNGNWYPWASGGQEQDFIQAFRHFVDTFRSVSGRFKFEWNVNQGDFNSVSNPELAYPGDQYVDIISMDAYYDTRWEGADPNKAFAKIRDKTYGLNWLESFADAHGKPIAFPEWGVNSDNAGPYIKQFSEWIASHNVVYQSYWESNSDFPAMLEDGQYPNAAATYKAEFGKVFNMPTPTPVTQTIGSGADSLVLKISQDAWKGSAQYTVSVDSKQVSGTLTASATASTDQQDTITINGDFASGNHTLTVTFINDAYGGNAATDRNLHVEGVSFNGTTLAKSTANLLSNGSANFNFSKPVGPAPTIQTIGSGEDSLVLKISQDAWRGSAQYTISVDNKQVGGILTASAYHALAQDDLVTVRGDFATGPHKLTVKFLNDAYDGSAAADRNLYVDGITYNGVAVANSTKAMLSGGPADFVFA